MLYTFYGDNFTGSTDVLENLARAAVPAALFFAPPTTEDLHAFPGLQALGIAGYSRSRTPKWMSAQLPGIFATLQSFGAPITHTRPAPPSTAHRMWVTSGERSSSAVPSSVLALSRS